MAWRRRKAEDPVSVNEKLARLSSEDLEALAESSLMMAQESLTRMGMSTKERPFHLERAVVYAEQAHLALVIIQDRYFS